MFPNFLRQKCSLKLVVFSDISLSLYQYGGVPYIMIWCREPLHRGIKRKRGSQI